MSDFNILYIINTAAEVVKIHFKVRITNALNCKIHNGHKYMLLLSIWLFSLHNVWSKNDITPLLFGNISICGDIKIC